MTSIINVLALFAGLLAVGCHSIGASDRDVSTAAAEKRFLPRPDSAELPCRDCGGISDTPSAVKLEDTDWKFIEFGDPSNNGSLVSEDIYLRLRSHVSAMRLFDGCNLIFGRYELRGQRMRFRINGITNWTCSEATDKQRRFLETLQASASWTIYGETLELYNSGNKMLARFEAQTVKEPVEKFVE